MGGFGAFAVCPSSAEKSTFGFPATLGKSCYLVLASRSSAACPSGPRGQSSFRTGVTPSSSPLHDGLRIAALVAALACSGLSRAGEIRPDQFRDLARRSVNILDTYHAYRQAFEEKRAKRYDSASGELTNRKNTFLLFLEFNPMLPDLDGEKGENLIGIQTNAGEAQSSMQKSYGAANFSYFFPDYEMGVYAIMDLVQLYTTVDDNPGREYLFKGMESDEPLDFSAGYVVLSGFFEKQGHGIDLGYLLRFEPFTYRDSMSCRFCGISNTSGGSRWGRASKAPSSIAWTPKWNSPMICTATSPAVSNTSTT